MKKLTKKFTAIVIALLVVSAISASSLVAMASVDENIEFSFSVTAHNSITQETDGRYRSTSDNNNAWKVRLITSTETDATKGCGSYFCLGLENEELASAWYLVERSSGAHYYPTNDEADFETVYLQCKDNNNSSKTYTVGGYWDEETGSVPD